MATVRKMNLVQEGEVVPLASPIGGGFGAGPQSGASAVMGQARPPTQAQQTILPPAPGAAIGDMGGQPVYRAEPPQGARSMALSAPLSVPNRHLRAQGLGPLATRARPAPGNHPTVAAMTIEEDPAAIRWQGCTLQVPREVVHGGPVGVLERLEQPERRPGRPGGAEER